MMKKRFVLTLLPLGMFAMDAVAADKVVVIPLISSSSASTEDSLWSTGSGDDIYRLNGNVGIGQSNPATRLDVNGVLSATGGNSTNWNTAYGWGDHSASGYMTSFTETDPYYSAAVAAGITATDVAKWNTAFDWGNHAAEGYLTTTPPLTGDVTGPFNATSVTDDSHNHSDSTVANAITIDNGSIYSQPVLRSDVGIGTTSPGASLHVSRPDTEVSSIYATGSSQGSGVIYAGQSKDYGGGISYDGDGNPAMVGGTDRVTFFRRSGGTDTEVMSYPQNSNNVTFAGNVATPGTIYGKLSVYSKNVNIDSPGD